MKRAKLIKIHALESFIYLDHDGTFNYSGHQGIVKLSVVDGKKGNLKEQNRSKCVYWND